MKRKALGQKGCFYAKSHLEWDDVSRKQRRTRGRRELLFPTSVNHTTCAWKGEASYYDIVVEGKINKDAAWYYPSPKEAAKHITGYVAFWKGVQVDDH